MALKRPAEIEAFPMAGMGGAIPLVRTDNSVRSRPLAVPRASLKPITSDHPGWPSARTLPNASTESRRTKGTCQTDFRVDIEGSATVYCALSSQLAQTDVQTQSSHRSYQENDQWAARLKTKLFQNYEGLVPPVVVATAKMFVKLL
jgi:hypothetical protein